MKRLILILSILFILSTDVTAEHKALKYGTPDTGRIIDYGTFVLSHDGRLRSARWVAERLTKESLRANVERKDAFRSDVRVPKEFRAKQSDYRGSGFDRGHLAPSSNHLLSRAANRNTFFLTNVSPQAGKGFNRNCWRKLEKAIRKRALDGDVKELYVFTGPLFMPEEAGQSTVTYRIIGDNHLPVPTHFFKAVLIVPTDTAATVMLYTFVLPNRVIRDGMDLTWFAQSVDFVEHWAGFDLWAELPDDVEDYKEGVVWGIWADD